MQTAEFHPSQEDTKKIMDDYYEAMNKYHEDCHKHNQRILRAIESVKGKAFKKNLMAALEDCETKDKYSLVRTPRGKFQSGSYGRGIPGYWCVQWSTGWEGDSFAGYVTFKLKSNLFLECHFEC